MKTTNQSVPILKAIVESLLSGPVTESFQYQVGDKVTGIMGIDGGYSGTVTRLYADSRGKRCVEFEGEGGKLHDTFEFNVKLTKPKLPARQQHRQKMSWQESDATLKISEWSTAKLQRVWDQHKDEQSPAPVFANQLKAIGQELRKRKADPAKYRDNMIAPKPPTNRLHTEALDDNKLDRYFSAGYNDESHDLDGSETYYDEAIEEYNIGVADRQKEEAQQSQYEKEEARVADRQKEEDQAAQYEDAKEQES